LVVEFSCFGERQSGMCSFFWSGSTLLGFLPSTELEHGCSKLLTSNRTHGSTTLTLLRIIVNTDYKFRFNWNYLYIWRCSIKPKLAVSVYNIEDRLCGLVARVRGYRSGGPGSIPATTRKKSSGSGTRSTQPREYKWGATWQKRSGSCLENREYGRRDPSRWPRGTLNPQKFAIISPTSGGRTVGVVRSQTQATKLVGLLMYWL
jgi:hypothetical protein